MRLVIRTSMWILALSATGTFASAARADIENCVLVVDRWVCTCFADGCPPPGECWEIEGVLYCNGD